VVALDCGTRRRNAYTLVEVLAVTVLLGVVASLGMPSLVRAIAGNPLERAAGRLALAFRDVRAQGYGHRLSLGLEPWGFTAVSSDRGGRTNLPTAQLPGGVQVFWSRHGRTTRAMELDPRGHGLDTDVTLRLDDRDLRFTIDGLTGVWIAKATP